MRWLDYIVCWNIHLSFVLFYQHQHFVPRQKKPFFPQSGTRSGFFSHCTIFATLKCLCGNVFVCILNMISFWQRYCSFFLFKIVFFWQNQNEFNNLFVSFGKVHHDFPYELFVLARSNLDGEKRKEKKKIRPDSFKVIFLFDKSKWNCLCKQSIQRIMGSIHRRVWFFCCVLLLHSSGLHCSKHVDKKNDFDMALKCEWIDGELAEK